MKMAGGGRALLFAHFLAFARSDFVGQSVEGEVEEGNYTYYTLKQTGDVRLELISIEGDADLYVGGEEEERPILLPSQQAREMMTSSARATASTVPGRMKEISSVQ